MTIFTSAEEAAAFVASSALSGAPFDLAIAEGCTFAGEPDTLGMGMAIILDAVLAQDYEPQGFEQCAGYRLYHYQPLSD